MIVNDDALALTQQVGMVSYLSVFGGLSAAISGQPRTGVHFWITVEGNTQIARSWLLFVFKGNS
ncbi:MAG: hypothetical protein ACI9W4_001788 [Rhodothermales bacterium]|jgi:hypothetical protein